MATAEQRRRMAARIIDYEARRDAAGHLKVYALPSNDGGGAYEIAGVNVKYHPAEAARLKAMIEQGQYAAADALAIDVIERYTDGVAKWQDNAGVEFYLRDCAFNRGPTGAAKILQRALGFTGADIDGDIGTETRKRLDVSTPGALLEALRMAREAYELGVAGRRENLWQGLVNRWNKALVDARKFAAETPDVDLKVNKPDPDDEPAPAKNWLLALIEAILAIFRPRATEPDDEPAAPQTPANAAGRWMSISAKEIGVKETPGPKSTPRILEYRAIAGCDLQGDDGIVAWCKIVLNAIITLAGLPIQKNWMARSIEHDPNFVRLDGPAIGAICSFWRGTVGGGLGHVGFYRGETKSGKIWVEGGNESDAFRRAFYQKNGKSMGVFGYYWPKSVPLPTTGAVYVDDDGSPIASAV